MKNSQNTGSATTIMIPLPKLRFAIVVLFMIHITAQFFIVADKYRRVQTGDIELFDLPGHEFSDLPQFLTGIKTIGYFTDYDFSPESQTTGSFLSAQYELAPIMLDADNADHPYILIDTASSLTAFALAEQMQATPVHLNPYGKLLVRTP